MVLVCGAMAGESIMGLARTFLMEVSVFLTFLTQQL